MEVDAARPTARGELHLAVRCQRASRGVENVLVDPVRAQIHRVHQVRSGIAVDAVRMGGGLS